MQAASRQWGSKGARINTISPGVTDTDMTKQEMKGPVGEQIGKMLVISPVSRIGTTDDIASAVAFLVGSESSFITGTDLLVDGGVYPAVRWIML